MRIKSVVALMCIGLILIMCGCRETREKLSVEEYFYKDGMGVDREPEMEAGGKIKQEYVSEDKEKERNYLRDENSTTRHYGEVRMAYHFTIGNYSVYIDAATGEDIAYSEKRMVARAFSADGEGAFPNPQKQTADATTCFNELG